MTEVAEEKKANQDSEEKVMCRHGFHHWIAKEEKRLDEKSQTMRPVMRCSHCGKEKLGD